MNPEIIHIITFESQRNSSPELTKKQQVTAQLIREAIPTAKVKIVHKPQDKAAFVNLVRSNGVTKIPTFGVAQFNPIEGTPGFQKVNEIVHQCINAACQIVDSGMINMMAPGWTNDPYDDRPFAENPVNEFPINVQF